MQDHAGTWFSNYWTVTVELGYTVVFFLANSGHRSTLVLDLLFTILKASMWAANPFLSAHNTTRLYSPVRSNCRSRAFNTSSCSVRGFLFLSTVTLRSVRGPKATHTKKRRDDPGRNYCCAFMCQSAVRRKGRIICLSFGWKCVQ